VVAIIGDGSFQYSLQSVYTVVQQGAHVIFLVLRNGEYGILKEFAVLEETQVFPASIFRDWILFCLARGTGQIPLTLAPVTKSLWPLKMPWHSVKPVLSRFRLQKN
jgi:thiamine pyrophosphate-dependent acetolactate synthase large subunit-like protein